MSEVTIELVFPRSGQRLQVRGAGLDVGTGSTFAAGHLGLGGVVPSPGGDALSSRSPRTMIRLWPAWEAGRSQ